MTSRILEESGVSADDHLSLRWKKVVAANPTWNELNDMQFLFALNTQIEMHNPFLFVVSERIMKAPIFSVLSPFMLEAISRTLLVSTDQEILQMPGIEESDASLIDSAFRMLQSQRD